MALGDMEANSRVSCLFFGTGESHDNQKHNRILHYVDATFLVTVGSFLLTVELLCLQLCLGAFFACS